MKERIIKFSKIVLSIILAICIPIFFIYILFGLAGSDKENFYIMLLGGIILIMGNISSYFKKWGWYIFFIGIFIVSIGEYRDNQFWKDENINTCKDLKENKTCTFTETSIHCSDSPLNSGNGFNSSNFCDNNF